MMSTRLRRLKMSRNYHKIEVFPGSSMVEHSAVNRRVASSNLARGATFRISQSRKTSDKNRSLYACEIMVLPKFRERPGCSDSCGAVSLITTEGQPCAHQTRSNARRRQVGKRHDRPRSPVAAKTRHPLQPRASRLRVTEFPRCARRPCRPIVVGFGRPCSYRQEFC